MKPSCYLSPGVYVQLVVDIAGMGKKGLQTNIAGIGNVFIRLAIY